MVDTLHWNLFIERRHAEVRAAGYEPVTPPPMRNYYVIFNDTPAVNLRTAYRVDDCVEMYRHVHIANGLLSYEDTASASGLGHTNGNVGAWNAEFCDVVEIKGRLDLYHLLMSRVPTTCQAIRGLLRSSQSSHQTSSAVAAPRAPVPT